MKQIATTAMILLCLLLASCGAGYGVESDYPAAIMVDGVTYTSTTREIPAEIDESAILGYANSYADGMPKKDGEINFNSELGNAYARCEGGIAVLIDNEWVLFEVKDEPKDNQGGFITFYGEATRETEKPEVELDFMMSTQEANELKDIIDSVEEWVDDHTVDRLAYYFNGHIEFRDWPSIYYFCYAHNVIYYDHYFAEISAEQMDVIHRISVESGIPVEYAESPVVKEFSYAEVLATYKEGDPGVKTEGFANTTAFATPSAQDAQWRAESECTIEYNACSVEFDEETNMWGVTFYTEGTLGGCQTVYLDDQGVTHLIVYGE